MTRLETMSDEEFRRSYEEGLARTEAEMVRQGLWSRDAASEAARAEMAQLLPQGRETPGFSFLKILDDATKERIGETWYSSDRRGGRPHAWVHWIFIDASQRRRGHARSALEQLAKRAKESGADRLGLHVLADNVGALALYARLGFVPTSHRLAKPLR